MSHSLLSSARDHAGPEWRRSTGTWVFSRNEASPKGFSWPNKTGTNVSDVALIQVIIFCEFKASEVRALLVSPKVSLSLKRL